MMASTTRLTPESLARQLSAFEEKYGITSAEFLEQYHAGRLGDDRDMMRWAWLCSVAVKLGTMTVREPETPMTA
jgi:hypothetical protein